MARDTIFYAQVDPTNTTPFNRSLWFNELTDNMWLWSNAAGKYVAPNVTTEVPDLSQATFTTLGGVKLAQQTDIDTGTDATKAVTSNLIAALKLAILGDDVPSNLNTLLALAGAVNNDPHFYNTIAQALEATALIDGSNVAEAALGASGPSIITAAALVAMLRDQAVTAQNVNDALSSGTVNGATGASGVQRFVTLPMLAAYVEAAPRTFVATALAPSTQLLVSDEVLFLDPTSNPLTLNIGNPSLFKPRRYTITCVAFNSAPVINFASQYPSISGMTTFTFSSIGQVVTLVPAPNGKWAFSVQ
jgi:hypothetical protein